MHICLTRSHLWIGWVVCAFAAVFFIVSSLSDVFTKEPCFIWIPAWRASSWTCAENSMLQNFHLYECVLCCTSFQYAERDIVMVRPCWVENQSFYYFLNPISWSRSYCLCCMFLHLITSFLSSLWSLVAFGDLNISSMGCMFVISAFCMREHLLHLRSSLVCIS